MREGIKRNIKSEISWRSKEKRSEYTFFLSLAFSSPKNTIPPAGYLALTPSYFFLLNLDERENNA
jgi:hypothetical protein